MPPLLVGDKAALADAFPFIVQQGNASAECAGQVAIVAQKGNKVRSVETVLFVP